MIDTRALRPATATLALVGAGTAARAAAPPENDNAGEGGPRHAPEAAARDDPAPLGHEWVDTEVADDATVIEADGGDPAVIAVPWS